MGDVDVAELVRDLYEMLRDSTPGPLPQDAPVRLLLQRARAWLDQEGTDG